jgi:hypothetical protein
VKLQVRCSCSGADGGTLMPKAQKGAGSVPLVPQVWSFGRELNHWHDLCDDADEIGDRIQDLGKIVK